MGKHKQDMKAFNVTVWPVFDDITTTFSVECNSISYQLVRRRLKDLLDKEY